MHDISRVTRSRAEARANYDRLSRWYDLIEGNWEAHPRRLGLSLLQVKPGEKMLEIGSGTGKSLLELPEQVCAVGMDLSLGMLALTKARMARVHKPALVVQGDAIHLPFANRSFNVIFMAFTLELMDTPEISIALGEVRRVLRPGGRVGIVSTSKLGGIGFMQKLYEWTHAQFPATVDCRPIYARNSLEDAGFTIDDYRLLTLTGLGIEVVIGSVE